MEIGRYFSAHEMRCRGWELRDSGRECSCHGATKWSERLIEVMDTIRESVLCAPAIVLNGFRCVTYNRSVDGFPTSFHMDGMAMDIRFDGDQDKMGARMGLVLADMIRPGLGNVLLYPGRGFIHVDVGPTNGKIVRIKDSGAGRTA